ncbi:aminoacyl-tRNA hydrolase [Mesobaculum littorinae]|uniref:Peptidyl-tRNA hydrolase n=1 Tax=Mesobaculum littorinae TaxID=2486419 RepID=A0A438AF86_9RHOB|nr:aminoacyl-tRNA hydrolase [Mesobaculum littorinae]RVV97267.1 aminoacyl-tRNA hydrolase [Mesobaculum littorinae]
MRLIIGLGNPGGKYARTRHNIGFMAVDRIAADHGFAPWRSKFQGQVTEGRLGSEKVVLLKPETYMNNSGQSVGEAMRFYKLAAGDLTVFHDEIDLAPGKLRLKTGGGHAGHNGLRSLHAHVGPDYDRVRMGVGHPGRKEAVPGYVLHDFPKADEDWLDDMLRGVSDGAPKLAQGDGPGFQNAVAQRLSPARSGTGTAPAQPPARRAPGAAPKPGAGAARPTGDTTTPKPEREPKPEPEDQRSPLQKLADRFR